MGSPVRTTVEELPDSRVRMEVEVPEGAVQHAIEHAASDLAESIRIPGFRKGKVPLRVVAARVGREALWAEAVRTHIDGWFWDAAQSSGVRPVSGPEVEWDVPPSQGGTFTFRATVPVAPKPVVADWTELEVPRPEPEVPAELVDAELDRLRAAVAELVPVSGRPVQDSDTLVLDLVAREEGKEPSSHHDYVVELGTGRLADEIESAVPGMREGETKTVEIEVTNGERGAVDVTVKEIKEKVLPELDDDLANASSEFETLGELRDDIEARLLEQLESELEARFREDALDTLVEASSINGVEPLVDRRAIALLAGFLQSLEQRGIQPEMYLTMTGQTPQALQEGLRAEAERAVKRELVLEAVAEAAAIEVSDEEVEELIRTEAAEAGEDPEPTLEAIRERGRYEQFRGDLRLRKALDEIVGGVKPIPVELARAREKLWTPEKEKGGSGMKIWTPGSEEGR
jgi:trigger factor